MSEQGSFHSMKSHFNSSVRSTGSVPASWRASSIGSASSPHFLTFRRTSSPHPFTKPLSIQLLSKATFSLLNNNFDRRYDLTSGLRLVHMWLLTRRVQSGLWDRMDLDQLLLWLWWMIVRFIQWNAYRWDGWGRDWPVRWVVVRSRWILLLVLLDWILTGYLQPDKCGRTLHYLCLPRSFLNLDLTYL